MVVGSSLILVRHVYLSGEYYARIICSSSWWIGINYVLYLVHFELVTKIPKNHNLFFTTIETKLESFNFGAQASLHASFGNVCPYLSPFSLTKACTVFRLEWTSKDYYIRPSINSSLHLSLVHLSLPGAHVNRYIVFCSQDKASGRVALCSAIFAGFAYVGYAVVRQTFGRRLERPGNICKHV